MTPIAWRMCACNPAPMNQKGETIQRQGPACEDVTHIVTFYGLTAEGDRDTVSRG